MIVIGDVHGDYEALMDLMEILPQTRDICFVGDLIDRGPKSKEVLQFVMDNKFKSVLGNHEDMMLYDRRLWHSNGARETIKSFGSIEELLKSRAYKWVEKLPIMIEHKNFLITHSYAYAGEETPPIDLLWGRNMIDSPPADIINIFGHTPFKEIKKIHNKHYCIDTGAVYGNKLSAIDLETMKTYSVEGGKFRNVGGLSQ
jgi:serine/threonine protein phosphatase 1